MRDIGRMHIKIHLGVMTSIWAISNEHGHWTVSIGDEITFMDNLATSSRLVRRAGVMNAPPTLADSHPDAPVINLQVWCVRGAGNNPTTVTVHALDVVNVEIKTPRSDA